MPWTRAGYGPAMDPQTLRDELGQPGAMSLLESAPLARLAYNGPDGFPRVVPCGFFWTGGAVVVCTATTAPTAETNDPPGQLYNLDDDVGESKNLYTENPQMVAQLTALLNKIRNDGRSRP